MMAPGRRSGFSDGMAVAIASVVLILGLTGLMMWRVQTESTAPVEVDTVNEAAIAAQAEATRLREELSGVNQQLRTAEARRLEAIAAAKDADQVLVRMDQLAAEREQLQEQVAELTRQNQVLHEQVAGQAMQAAAPPQPADLPAATGDAHSVSAKVLHDVRVVDANKDLEYVVLNAGRQDGVRAGMVFHVMQGDQVVARLRAADVRDDLTGSTVEDVVAADRYPEPADRVILGKSSEQ